MSSTPISQLSQGHILSSARVADFRFAESAYREGLRMSKHSHRSGFISVTTHGAYTESIGNDVFECSSHSVVYHPAEEPHEVTFKNVHTRILQIELAPVWLKENSSVFESLHRPRCFEKGFLNSIAANLYREYKSNDPFSHLAVHSLVLELIVGIGRQKSKGSNTSIPAWLSRVEDMIRDEYISKPSLKEISKAAGVSPIHLAREFRRKFGCTIGEYIRKLRIEKASKALADTNLRFSEIAHDTGFYDQSHFTNTFKRYSGLTPSEYRRKFGR